MTYESFFSKLQENYLHLLNKAKLKFTSPTLDCLFTKIGNNKLTDMGQSLSDIDSNKKANFFLYWRHDELINYLFNLSKTMIDNELRLCNKNYSVYYHAQKLFFIILEDLKQILYELHNKEKLQNFCFVRQINSSNLNSIYKYENVNDYLNKFYKSKLGWNYDPNIYECLLAVNNNLFANLHAIENSSFFYFLKDTNVQLIDVATKIKELFIEYNLTDLYSKLEREINEAIETLKKTEPMKTGIYLQIFIPNHLKNLVYDSLPHGHPKNKKCCKLLYYLINRLGNYFTGAHLDNDGEFRILLNPKYFMNPHNGILIYRYINENSLIIKEYRKQLENIKKIIYNYFSL